MFQPGEVVVVPMTRTQLQTTLRLLDEHSPVGEDGDADELRILFRQASSAPPVDPDFDKDRVRRMDAAALQRNLPYG